MVRDLAGWDPDHYARVTRWPIREALASYARSRRIQVKEDYHLDQLHYLLQAPHVKDPIPVPEIPKILKD